MSENSTEFYVSTHINEEKGNHLHTMEEVAVEERSVKSSCLSTDKQVSIFQMLYSKIFDFNKIERILAFCLRFVSNCKVNNKRSGPLEVAEIENAKLHLIKNAQIEVFHEEILALQRNTTIKHSSKLLALHPFLDDRNLIRVGGRLRSAPLSFSRKHPILLPPHHILTKLLIEREYKRLLHSGPQALLASIRRKYWPYEEETLSTKYVTLVCGVHVGILVRSLN